MCSTPCGIEARSRLRHPDHARVEGVLNALRHRGEVEWRPRRPAKCGSPSAQRLAASRRGRVWPISLINSVALCSTPCGIEARSRISKVCETDRFASAQRLAASRRGRAERRGLRSSDPLCSTPCGIEARSRFVRETRACDHAQRLAASRRGRERGSTSGCSRALPCSTPCGIEARSRAERTATGTRKALRRGRDGQTISTVAISRHLCSTPRGIEARSRMVIHERGLDCHRCSTPCGIEARSRRRRCSRDCSGSRAQRLAASRRGRDPPSFPRICGASCAQRLAASRRGRDLKRGSESKTVSLCSTPCGIEARSRLARYLEGREGELCSTPCGIEARSSGSRSRSARPWQRAQRLAASRRGRGPSRSAFSSSHDFLCSTPCGIEARSSDSIGNASEKVAVLNALRHRGEVEREVLQALGLARPKSAQRLAASRRGRARLCNSLRSTHKLPTSASTSRASAQLRFHALRVPPESRRTSLRARLRGVSTSSRADGRVTSRVPSEKLSNRRAHQATVARCSSFPQNTSKGGGSRSKGASSCPSIIAVSTQASQTRIKRSRSSLLTMRSSS